MAVHCGGVLTPVTRRAIWAVPAALAADTAESSAAVITAAERGLSFTLNGW
jgi:hypothetical protein